MRFFIKLVHVSVLSLGLFVISACFDNGNETKQSLDEGPALDVNVNVETNSDGVPIGMKLRAAPEIYSVSLDWDPVSQAADYKVSRQLEGGDLIVITTAGATSFTFSAQADSTYHVSVAAIDATGKTINVSKAIKVVTGAADAVKLSDEGL